MTNFLYSMFAVGGAPCILNIGSITAWTTTQDFRPNSDFPSVHFPPPISGALSFPSAHPRYLDLIPDCLAVPNPSQARFPRICNFATPGPFGPHVGPTACTRRTSNFKDSCTSDGVYRRNDSERPDRLCEEVLVIAAHRARKETWEAKCTLHPYASCSRLKAGDGLDIHDAWCKICVTRLLRSRVRSEVGGFVYASICIIPCLGRMGAERRMRITSPSILLSLYRQSILVLWLCRSSKRGRRDFKPYPSVVVPPVPATSCLPSSLSSKSSRHGP